MKQVMERHLKLLSGRSHPELANEIAKKVGVPLSQVNLEDFANGEIACKIDESVRGCDVFILQTHYGNVNDAIIEQALLIDAAKRASAHCVTAVCPLLGYARQDRKASGREPVAARVIVDLLATAGADRLISVDLHSGQTQGFFNGPFDHLIARPVLVEYIKKHFQGKDIMVVSPDAGGVKSAERYASELGCDIAIIHKYRSTTVRNKAEAKYLIGDVKGKTCLVVDDMVDTAGTICAAADLLAENGAKEVYGVATHGILSDPALENIDASAFKQVIVTNTVPTPNSKKGKIVTVSIAGLVADSIKAVFAGSSVSALFNGQNQK